MKCRKKENKGIDWLWAATKNKRIKTEQGVEIKHTHLRRWRRKNGAKNPRRRRGTRLFGPKELRGEWRRSTLLLIPFHSSLKLKNFCIKINTLDQKWVCEGSLNRDNPQNYTNHRLKKASKWEKFTFFSGNKQRREEKKNVKRREQGKGKGEAREWREVCVFQMKPFIPHTLL